MPDEFSLKNSVDRVGRLVPIIKDANGNLIDGMHRHQIDPKWAEEFVVVLDHIDTPEKLAQARIEINNARRTVQADEKTKALAELAELTGWTPKEISKRSGMSYRWVMDYIPDKFKQKSWKQIEKPIASLAIGQETVKKVHEMVDKTVCSKCQEETLIPQRGETGEIFCLKCWHEEQVASPTSPEDMQDASHFQNASPSPGDGEPPSTPRAVITSPMFPLPWKQWIMTTTPVGDIDPSQYIHPVGGKKCLCRHCPKALKCVYDTKETKP